MCCIYVFAVLVFLCVFICAWHVCNRLIIADLMLTFADIRGLGDDDNAPTSSRYRLRPRRRIVSAGRCHVYTSHACQLGDRLVVSDRSVAADTPGQVGQRPIELQAEVCCAVAATVQN